MRNNKTLSLDNLLDFYSSKGIVTFNSSNLKEEPIIVQTYGDVEVANEIEQGLLPVTLKCCHTGLNRNGSYISNEVMEDALSTFKNKPILADIREMPDGTYDFYSHTMEIDDENNEIIYIEKPIGVIPESCNAHLKYDEVNNKNYVEVNGYLYEEYGNKACDILREKGSTKVSIELAIYDMDYDASNNVLILKKICCNGVTALGRNPETNEEILEGMKGSCMTVSKFNKKGDFKVEIKKYNLNYELSHDDIRVKIYELLRDKDEDHYFWICEVYDDRFIYQHTGTNKYFMQYYTKEDDKIVFVDDKIEVFNQFVTENEKNLLEIMREEYKELKTFKENIEKEKERNEKENILFHSNFSIIAENHEYKQLVKDMDIYSVEEVENKAKVIFANHLMKNGAYENTTSSSANKNKVSFSIESDKDTPYGDLFK